MGSSPWGLTERKEDMKMSLMDLQKAFQNLTNEQQGELLQKLTGCKSAAEMVALFKEYGLAIPEDQVEPLFALVQENMEQVKKQAEMLADGYEPPDVEITEEEMDQLHGEGYIFAPVTVFANANIAANVNGLHNANVHTNANANTQANVNANANWLTNVNYTD